MTDCAPKKIWLDWALANLDGDGNKKKIDKVCTPTAAETFTDINVM